MLKVAQGTFAAACCWSLLDIQKCTDGLYMAPSPLDKQTASCDSLHNWPMSWAMDLKWHQCMLFGCSQCWRSLGLPLCGSLPYPYRSACDIGYSVETLEWQEIQLASYPFISWCIGRLWIAIESWWIACKYLFSFLRYKTSNN